MGLYGKPIPSGYTTITPGMTFKDSVKAMSFYQRAFGAEIIDRLPAPNGSGTMHATIKIGNSLIMLGDERPQADCGKSAETLGGSPISLYVYVDDVDATFNRALNEGARLTMPVTDMFWGDRCGSLVDPFGYPWMIATHRRDLSTEEIEKASRDFFCPNSR